jgi:hypothetical protein
LNLRCKNRGVYLAKFVEQKINKDDFHIMKSLI